MRRHRCDVHDVARGMGMDNRIGRKFLHPGAGLRRFMLPKMRALQIGENCGGNRWWTGSANECQRQAMLPKVEKWWASERKTIAFWAFL